MAKEVITGRVHVKSKLWVEQTARLMKTTESYVLEWLIKNGAGDALPPDLPGDKPFKDWGNK